MTDPAKAPAVDDRARAAIGSTPPAAPVAPDRSIAAAVDDRPAPLLVDAAEAARLCSISRASWFAWTAAGLTPAPIRLGLQTGRRAGRVLWRRAELVRWIDAGCPPRERWATMKGASR